MPPLSLIWKLHEDKFCKRNTIDNHKARSWGVFLSCTFIWYRWQEAFSLGLVPWLHCVIHWQFIALFYCLILMRFGFVLNEDFKGKNFNRKLKGFDFS